MIDLLDQSCQPSLEDVSRYIRNPVFDQFCGHLETGLGAKHQLSFSRCSWMPGWNVKFRKGRRSLCTVYPREGFFTVLVVIGPAERSDAELLLPDLCPDIREIYCQTEEGSGQRWLMIDLEDADCRFKDCLRLIEVRRNSKKQKM